MDVVGGGVLVAVAAALWVAYLLPSWWRRRQYNATERNAVRLQQTLRILAETAEVPEPVRLEATAREVAAQQRILAAQENAARLEAETARLAAEAAEQLALAERRAAAEAVAAARSRATQLTVTEPIAIVVADAPAAPTAASRPVDAAAARRRRRARAACTLVLLASLVAIAWGIVALATGGSALVALLGGAGAVGALTSLVGLARRRTEAPVAAAQPIAERPAAPVFEPIEVAETEPVAQAGWTPRPLPKPLHLSRGTIAATAMASIEAAARLQRAAADEAMVAKAAELAPTVPTLRRPATPAAEQPSAEGRESRPAAANPYAAMGVIEASDARFDDLDAVLRRRRAV
ncbi:hypothetical protein ACWKWP_15345 [Agromyces soli]